MTSDIPRPEYPRPHRKRTRWLNLNGTWEFAFDDADRGRAEGWESEHSLPGRIVVPFTFEAPLSGIGDTAVHPVVWYRRLVDIPDDFFGGRLLLHIGACDFESQVWINGHAAAAHRGGYSPFTCEIQDLARPGRNEVVVRVADRPVWAQPRGKQTVADRPLFIDYDRVTGIWQTVWLEPVPDVFIEDAWSHFDLQRGVLHVCVQTNRECGGEVEATLSFAGETVGTGRAFLQDRRAREFEVEVPKPRLWSPADPALYDLRLALRNESGDGDVVETYTGLRQFTQERGRLLLNGEPFYFRAVLDQGYFPGGWYTAPSDDDLRRDIELMQAMGLNGARKHQKAEDPRWLYWADKLGFVVWGEMGNGRDFNAVHVDDLTREWGELVRRDRMHPSIMAWVPLNESWGVDSVGTDTAQQQWVRALYHLTRALDPTRLVIGNDGWQFVAGDIWGIHSYLPDGATLQRHLAKLLADPTAETIPGRIASLDSEAVRDLPAVLTEFGGFSVREKERPVADAWAYAEAEDADDLAARIRDLVSAVRRVRGFHGFVWTQLTDVQQEVNGLLYFDRKPKVSLETLQSIFAAPAEDTPD